MTMRVHFLKTGNGYEAGDTPWIERTLARRLCDNEFCETYPDYIERLKEEERQAKERAAAEKKKAAVAAKPKRRTRKKKATSKAAETREKTVSE